MLRLEVVRGDNKGVVVETDAETIHLGRGSANDLILSAAHVSGRHATIFLSAEGYVLRDEGSTNGTRVARADKEFDAAATDAVIVLEPGDRIELGKKEQAVFIAVDIVEDASAPEVVTMRTLSDLNEVERDIDRELLRRLYEMQKRISEADELDDVLAAVASSVFSLVSRASHVTAVLNEQDAESLGRFVPVGTRCRDDEDASPIPVTKSVFRKVLKERVAVLAANAPEEMGEPASLIAASIRSTIGVPLWRGERITGVLQVDNRTGEGMLSASDLDVVALVAQSASQAFERAATLRRLRIAEERHRSENTFLKSQEQGRRFDGILSQSEAMNNVVTLVRKVADTNVVVLIEGETGTGKELVASALHYWSKRADKLLIAQNCAALPETLLESELFGHKRGAFTGAITDKKGLFELADGGTLFLDEVGEMPPSLQAKLLRVLQDNEVRPLGAAKSKYVDVRIVAATNRQLDKEVAEGRFREDLFYRLRVVPIRVPPLRERPADLPLLANHFLTKYSAEFGQPVAGFSQEAIEVMQSYKWPGNVRELQNETQRLVIEVQDGAFVQVADLSPRIREMERVIGRARPQQGTLKQMVEEVEKWILRDALKDHNNNKSATAKTLGITREGLHKKLKNYGMA